MTRTRQPTQPQAGRLEPAYNLFRREHEPDLCCAVPQDHRVPAFISPDQWSYAGTIHGGSAPLGFRARAAHDGVRLNGFYLFHAHQVRPRLASVAQTAISPPQRLATAVRRARRSRLQAAQKVDGPNLGTVVGAQIAGADPSVPASRDRSPA